MLSSTTFSIIIPFLILAPTISAIMLLSMSLFEKRIDLFESINLKNQLEIEIQTVKYDQLNQQIQPHFLFNTLNALLGLARLKRYDDLLRALEEFSCFLKFKYRKNEYLVTLIQEIEYTGHYLEIQKLRYGERLQIDIDCDADIMECYVPPFILQTIVENAFKHGLEKKTGDVNIRLSFFPAGENLMIRVTDNGVLDETSGDMPAGGTGLNNIKKRLQLYFDDKAELKLCSGADGCTEAMVRLPLINHYELKEAAL